MRKMLLTPLIVCMVALLPTLWMPAVHATPPTKVSVKCHGWDPDPHMEWWQAGDNIVIMHVWGGGGQLLGPLWGKWIHDEWQVVNLNTGMVTMNGVWDTPEGVAFIDDGDEYFGNLHVQYRGTADMATGVFQGEWVILSGTGDLANLRGGGTIWFDPLFDPLYLYGDFWYHFDP